MKSVSKIFFMPALVLACAGLASAAPIVAYSNPTGTGTQSYTGALGMDFTVNSPTGINVYSVGIFDSGQNGYSQSMTVQFYNLSNTASPIFSISVPSGMSGTMVGGSEFFS